jgi:hypothetical protein
MHDLDKLLLVHYKCDRKHRWSVDVSSKEEWYKFPSKLSARLFNNLVATLKLMIEDLKKCSSKEVVYVHTGINKKNIVMNKSGVFKFLHHNGIHAATPSMKTESYNVAAAREFLGKVMSKQAGGSEDDPKPIKVNEIERDILASLKSIGGVTERTLNTLPLPIRLKYFLLDLPLPKEEVKPAEFQDPQATYPHVQHLDPQTEAVMPPHQPVNGPVPAAPANTPDPYAPAKNPVLF